MQVQPPPGVLGRNQLMEDAALHIRRYRQPLYTTTSAECDFFKRPTLKDSSLGPGSQQQTLEVLLQPKAPSPVTKTTVLNRFSVQRHERLRSSTKTDTRIVGAAAETERATLAR